MQGLHLLNYLLAFLEGLALIISPCILPILPILLSGGVEGGRRRPFGIIVGFVLSFALFTFFSRQLVQYFGLNLDWVRQIAFALIAAFGVILISDKLSLKFSLVTQDLANRANRLSSRENQNGFGSGLFLGALISLIWVPCGGPILASAIVQTAVQRTSLESFLTFFFFALGSALPMILITLLGRSIIKRFNFLQTKTEALRKIFGMLIIIGALIAEFAVPSAGFISLPQAPNVMVIKTIGHDNQLIDGLEYPYPAPSIQSQGAWLNSKALKLADLKGKVVLIDFWTYSCINCIRSLPYIEQWYADYKDQGLVIIGVHAPEFEFEKNINNVKNAVQHYGILYPVVLDNDYVIWQNYNNHYWPAHYLIDKNGQVVYQHFGEGNYAETEHNIQVLLGLKDKLLNKNEMSSPVIDYEQTPETYLGYARSGVTHIVTDLSQNQEYHYPENLKEDDWALEGQWKINSQQIISLKKNAAIKINFKATKVYIVAGAHEMLQPIPLKIKLNGNAISNQEAGSDVKEGILELSGQRLYQVINLNAPQEAILEIISTEAGAEFYTFTFG